MVFQDTVQLSQLATIIISVEQLDSMLLSICSVIDPTSKCGKDKKISHKPWPSMSLMFLPHFDILDVIYHCYHPLQHRIYLLYTIKRQNVANGEVIYVTVLQQILSKNQSNCMYNSPYHKNLNFLNCRWF